MMNHRRLDTKCSLRIPNHKVRVIANGNHSLTMIQTNQTRRSATQPVRQMTDRISALACQSPHHGQPQLQRRDTTPRFQKISSAETLHARRARAVIRNDHLNQSFVERAPQLLAVLALSDRRATFELRCAVADVFGCEAE